MPKETFYNLDKEKREKIERVALSEFANFGFHGAKVNRVVDKSGISKGSFYQYFTGMDDLFVHIVENLGKKKISFIGSELKLLGEKDFFEKFESMFLSGVKFYYSLSEDEITISKMLPIIKNLCSEKLEVMKKEANQIFFEHLIDEAISTGEIQADRDFAFVVISNTSKQIIQYLRRKNKVMGIEKVFENESNVKEAISLFLDLLKMGLTKKEGKNE